MQADIIIIGAGPAGLMAARELAQSGKKVLVLEARNRIGGRAHTIDSGGGKGVEAGAEFVHGELPITLSLLKEAGLSVTPTGGSWVQVKSGETLESRDNRHWPLLMRKLKILKEDMPLQDFLEQHFSEDKYAALKDRAIAYAEGYDSADASRVSAKALYAEWSGEEEEQFRIEKGYGALMDFIVAGSQEAGGEILLSHPVSAITAADSGVSVSAGGRLFTAAKAVIALPLGVLQHEDAPGLSGPSAAAYLTALQAMGMGDVIKFVFRFTRAFWEDAYPGLGFLMSGAAVPTWWTQAPAAAPLLTGWLPGRAARAQMHLTTAQLRDSALRSLAQIFSIDLAELEGMLRESHIHNWSADPYTRGAYAYTTVGAAAARQVLGEPLDGRIFFAGEYMYDGPAMGTVEAALHSGRETAWQILA